MSELYEVRLPRGDHVPGGLIYGPVDSRRFGRSLGVSCSWPGRVTCRWRCPYCQLGHLPYRPFTPVPPAAAVLRELDRALAECDPSSLEVITVAGSGEPTTHPDFAAIAAGVVARARARGLGTILLSNGDGLGDPAALWACARFDAVYLKWDPGPKQGSWSADHRWREDRRALLGRMPELRIQALLYQGPGTSVGNSGAAVRERWLADLAELDLAELQLTTIDRRPGRDGLRPVQALQLRRWAESARERLGVPVRAFPGRREAEEA